MKRKDLLTMKKRVISLLAFLLFLCSGVSAAISYSGDAPVTRTYGPNRQVFLDVAHTASNATISASSTATLAFDMYYLIYNWKPAWMAYVSINTASGNYIYANAADEGFLPVANSSSYDAYTNSYNAIKVSSARPFYFYVTGITGVAVLHKDASSSNKLSIQVEEVFANGTLGTAYITTSVGNTSVHKTEYAASELNAKKYYRVTLTGTNNNHETQQIRFTKATITDTPSILTDLSSTYTVYEGSKNLFRIDTDCADTYQWYTNTTASNEGGSPISGATSPTYLYTPTSTDKENSPKYFYCVATNSTATDTKTVTSTVATVTVSARRWIGLQQVSDGVASGGNVATLAAATYSGIDHLTVSEAHGDSVNVNQATKVVQGPDGTYSATKSFRKNLNSSGFGGTKQWLGYSIVVESGYKMSLSNLWATLWGVSGENTTIINWRIQVENSDGTVLYTSETKNNRSNPIGELYDPNPSGISDLTPGTYYVKMFMYQSGNTTKYFAVPYLTFDAAVDTYAPDTYTVTTSVAEGQSTYGSVTATADYDEKDNVVITATSNDGYKFVNWTVDDVEQDGVKVDDTHFTYTFNSIAASHTIVANFAARKTISFSGTSTYYGTREDNAFGTIYADAEDKFTSPANLYLGRNNYTLTAWYDGSSNHTVGNTIDCSGGNKTLTPIWTANSGSSFAETLEARTASFTLTWNMGDDAANFNFENKTGYYVQQATIAGSTVDVPMFIDAATNYTSVGGKVYNVDYSSFAQTNAGTIFSVPVLTGSVVTLVAYTALSTTTINGSTEYELSNSNKTATYTYSGSTGTIDIVIGENNQYLYSISVTYPEITTPTKPQSDLARTWDFSSSAAQSVALNGGTFSASSTITLYDTNQTSTMTYLSGSSDAMDSSNGYLKHGGNSGSVNKRYFILPITSSGTLTIYSKANFGIYDVKKAASEDTNYSIATSINTITTTTLGTGVDLDITYDADKPYLFIGLNTASGNKPYTQKIVWTPTTETLTLTTSANMEGLRAFYDANNGYTLDSNTKAYIAISNNEYTVKLRSIDRGIPAGTPVILYTTSSADSYKMTLTKATVSAYSEASDGTNLLIYTKSSVSNKYRLGYGSSGKGFYPYSGTPSDGAVILNVSSEAGARSLTISFDDEIATGVADVRSKMEDIRGEYFDLQGRRISQPTRGLYIVNGKKVFVK